MVDVLLIVTEWNEVRSLNLEARKELMKQPLVFDRRNVWNAVEELCLGYTYWPIGRPGCES